MLTLHAIERYRHRVNPKATTQEIQQALDDGQLRFTTPGWAHALQMPAGVVVGPGYAFVMHEIHGKMHAVTVIAKRRIPKADRRLYREEGRGWACQAA